MHEYFPAIIDLSNKETGKIFGDLSGPFPICSLSGNRTKMEIMHTFDILHEYLQHRGVAPQYVKMDNEASQSMLHNLEDKKIKYQLVPLYMHQQNLVKCAIQTFKNHFLSGLASTDPEFPHQLWDKLIPQ
eukprot:6161779-Ditylum_brightwellii.AAC.1